jgi:hypothetical protein
MPSWMSRRDKPAELAAVAAPDKPSSPRRPDRRRSTAEGRRAASHHRATQPKEARDPPARSLARTPQRQSKGRAAAVRYLGFARQHLPAAAAGGRTGGEGLLAAAARVRPCRPS